jgi:hypothetical protein
MIGYIMHRVIYTQTIICAMLLFLCVFVRDVYFYNQFIVFTHRTLREISFMPFSAP